MKKIHNLVKNHGKIFIIFLVTLLVLPSCTVNRNIGFSGNVYTAGVDRNNSVSIKDFDFDLKTSLKSDNFPEDAYPMLKKRLEEQLMAKHLNPVTEGEAAYKLRGKLYVREKDSINGWIVPFVIVGLGLFPIGLFISMAMPATDLDYKAETDINLVDTKSNRTILTKNIEKTQKISVNTYQANIKKPDSKTNYTLTRTIDTALMDIAQEVSQAIANDDGTFSSIVE